MLRPFLAAILAGLMLPLALPTAHAADLFEQAGGLASTGRGRILEVPPERIHQRVPVILGSRAEVQRVERYHAEYDKGDDQPYSSPLFAERSLFRSS